jgi:hypothetical protein
MDLGLSLVGSGLTLRVLACLDFARVVIFLRRIRRVFRATGLLSHVFGLGCGFVWGVWGGA